MSALQDLYTKPVKQGSIEDFIMRVGNSAWSEMTLLEQGEMRENVAQEISQIRDLLAAVRETRHMGSFAVPAHIKAALELYEEQTKGQTS